MHTAGESEPYLSHTHYELAPHLLHPRQDPVPSADSHRGVRIGGASESSLLHKRYDPASAVAAAAARPLSAVFLRTRHDPAPDTGSHQGARTGGAPDSHLSTTPPLTTADPSATATSAATTFVASSSPDANEGSADHFSAPAPPATRDTTATDEPTTETPTVPPPPPFHVPEGAKDDALAASSPPGVALNAADGVTAAATSATDTDPVPAVTAPPIAEHISSFLLYTRRRLADNATATAASIAPVLPASPFPGVTVGTAEGATATAAPAADTGMLTRMLHPPPLLEARKTPRGRSDVRNATTQHRT